MYVTSIKATKCLNMLKVIFKCLKLSRFLVNFTFVEQKNVLLKNKIIFNNLLEKENIEIIL